MPEEETTTDTTGGETIDVVTELEEAPEVGPSGTIGQQPTDAELDQYAEARLRAKGFRVEREQRETEGTVRGETIPLSIVSQEDWDEMTSGERVAARVGWKSSQMSAQASEARAQQLAAPMLRRSAIDQIAQGLDERTRPYLLKVIEGMEEESGVPFAPEKVTKNMAELLQNAAIGAAAKGPKPAPTVGKEPATTESKTAASADEQAVIDEVKRMSGMEWSVDRARKYLAGSKN